MKYILTIIFTIIEVAIASSILNDASYSNNQDVIASLGILYAVMRGQSLGLSFYFTQFTKGIMAEIIRINERIRADDETREAWVSLNQANKKSDTENIKLIIRSIGVLIIFVFNLISLLNL